MKTYYEILKKIGQTISSHKMIDTGERIVVAVSGGADSVCLLDALYELKNEFEMDLVVAHFDHGLRPGDDEEETRFVKSLAQGYGLHFVTKSATGSLGSKHRFSEDRARRIRYGFFNQVLEETSSSKIAMGHHLDDQAETVLMRLIRGSGPSGLGGIPPVRDGRVIRPLIEVKRIEIEDYLEVRGLKYVTDPTNFDKNHFRNRVRMELLPLLEDYQPKVVEILGKTADILRQDETWLADEAKGWLKENARFSEEGEIVIPLEDLKSLPRALKSRAIRSGLEMVRGDLQGVNLRHIDSVVGIAESRKANSKLDLPGNITIKKSYDKLIFSPNSGIPPVDFCFFLDRPGHYSLEEPGIRLSIEILEGKDFNGIEPDPQTAFLNGDRILFPLCVRNFRHGDRFVPLGMKGHKKIKDFLIDLKIPLNDRKRLAIVTYEDRPIWICGLRIDDRYKVAPQTKKILKISTDKI
jgi:tRNA(Ile)-lysidine synthase